MVQLKYQYTNTNVKRKGDNNAMIINPLPGDLVRKKSQFKKHTDMHI